MQIEKKRERKKEKIINQSKSRVSEIESVLKGSVEGRQADGKRVST